MELVGTTANQSPKSWYMETQSTTVLFRISQLKFLPGNMVFVSQLSNVSIPEISKNASACITVTESPWGGSVLKCKILLRIHHEEISNFCGQLGLLKSRSSLVNTRARSDCDKKMCISTIVGGSNVFSLHANDDSPAVFTNPDKPCFSGEVTHIWDHTMGVV